MKQVEITTRVLETLNSITQKLEKQGFQIIHKKCRKFGIVSRVWKCKRLFWLYRRGNIIGKTTDVKGNQELKYSNNRGNGCQKSLWAHSKTNIEIVCLAILFV